MRVINKFIIPVLLFAFLTPATLYGQRKGKLKPFSYVQELEQLYKAELLPEYRTDCIVEQESSYDRTDGNDDGFNGTYSYIRKENGKLVIADLKGPGVINRIWTPTPSNDTLEFYFDGEKQPRLRISFNDLFSGKVYPFVSPLCGNEIGGYYCYLPIPYKKSCKVVYTGKTMYFYQLQYRNLPGYDVDSYTGNLTAGEADALTKIAEKWQQPLSPEGNYLVHEDSFVLEPGKEHTFFSMKEGGRIAGFEIDDNSYFRGDYKDILLNAVWDNEESPAINAPVSDFFGYAFGKPSMQSLLAGKKGDINYCYMPAPVDENAQMKLVYKKRSGIEQPSILIRTKVYYNAEKRQAEKEGKLYTAWRRQINPPAGEYYEFLSVEGKGHYVGTTQQAQGLRPEMTLFFEGDDSTYVDGKMRIHGTGSEDYYNGGWYALADRWDTGISLPIHGSLNYSLPFAQTGGYRFFLTDKMPFEREMYHGIEHGPERNEYPVDYTSVAYYYADKPGVKLMEPIENLRVVNQPREFRFHLQLMKFVIFHNTNLHYGRSMAISHDHEGGLKFFLDDIPEGRYKIYMSYFKKPDGGEFAVWQRQNMIQDWKTTVEDKERLSHKEYIGETWFTPQTNTLTIKIRNSKANNPFEIDALFLERMEE